MNDNSHQFDSSVRDGIFDGSADDIADLSHPDFADDDYFSDSRRGSRRGYQDLSGAPSWVKAFVWTGALLAIAGFGVILFSVLGPSGAPEPRSLTPAFPTAVTLGDVPPDFTDGQLPPGFPNQPMPPEFQPFETPGFPQRPTAVGGPDLALGFGLFFAGFVLTAIGALGHSTSTRR